MSSGIVTGAVRVWTAYRPGQRSPSWGESEVWSSIHGQFTSPPDELSGGSEPRTDSGKPNPAGVCIICACLPVCWPLASPLFSKVRGSTVSLRDHWRSRNSPHWYGAKSAGERSREDKDRSESAYTPRPPDTELLSVSRYGTSPDSGAYLTYPHQVRTVSSSDSEDGILIIQGGHNVEGQRFGGFSV